MAGQLSQECEPYILPLFDDHSEALMGKNVSWLCRALGSHDLELYWRLPQELYGGGNIQEGTCQQRACVKENTLTVRYLHPSDTGKYTCVAKNKFGQDQRKVTLTVKVNSAYCHPENIQFISNRSLAFFAKKTTTTTTQNCRKKCILVEHCIVCILQPHHIKTRENEGGGEGKSAMVQTHKITNEEG